MKSPAELIERFREEGLKVTPQRELVFRLMHENQLHPTAESVFGAAREVMPTISLKTVYAVLNDLKSLGEIQSIDVGSGAARFDPNVGEHHHVVCRLCGVIGDVLVDTRDLVMAPSDHEGFAIDNVEVTFRGVCRNCTTKQL